VRGFSKKLSIVIVTYNSASDVEECLCSIGRETRGIDYEIWVVDNASRDGTLECVRRVPADVHVIANDHNWGFSKACNQAIAKAAGDFILLLNPDTIVLDDAIGKLVRRMEEDASVGMAGGLVLNSDGSPQLACRRGMPTPAAMLCRAVGLDRLFPRNPTIAQYNMRWLPWEEEAEVASISGSFQMVRRTVVDQIGLLDEAIFMYFEDIDWCLRTTKAGWRVVYFPDSRIIHHKGRSTRKNLANARREFYRSYLHLYEKYFASEASMIAKLLIRLIVCIHRVMAIWFMR